MIHYYYYSAILDVYVTIGKNEYEFISLYINVPYSDWEFQPGMKMDMRINRYGV